MNKADPVFNYSKPVPGPDLAKRAGFNRVRVRFRVPGRTIVPNDGALREYDLVLGGDRCRG